MDQRGQGGQGVGHIVRSVELGFGAGEGVGPASRRQKRQTAVPQRAAPGGGRVGAVGAIGGHHVTELFQLTRQPFAQVTTHLP